MRMLSEKRHQNQVNADTAGVVAADQRILESNLGGECSRLCVRGGGSSSMNAMVYMRGRPQDYDAWRDAGCLGWGWDDLLPLS